MPASIYNRWWVLLLLLSGSVLAQPDSPVGNVSLRIGQVDVIRNGQPPQDLAISTDVFTADTLLTGTESMVEVSLLDGSAFTLDENTQQTVAQYVTGAAPRGRLMLLRGGLRAKVSKTFSKHPDAFQVETNQALMGVQGTEFEVLAYPLETRVFVYDGIVSVTSKDPDYPEAVILTPGEFVTVRLGAVIPAAERFFDYDDISVRDDGPELPEDETPATLIREIDGQVIDQPDDGGRDGGSGK